MSKISQTLLANLRDNHTKNIRTMLRASKCGFERIQTMVLYNQESEVLVQGELILTNL
jgi:hypothetical protein